MIGCLGRYGSRWGEDTLYSATDREGAGGGIFTEMVLSASWGTICYALAETRHLRKNIPLCLKEFPRAKPEGAPEGKGVYLTVYPESSILF